MSVVTRDQLEAHLADLRAQVGDPHAGVFGPGSAAWTIASDVGLFVGSGRAALLQLAHPMVAYAIDQHSHTRADVLGRFQRTFDNVFAMVFGDSRCGVRGRAPRARHPQPDPRSAPRGGGRLGRGHALSSE